MNVNINKNYNFNDNQIRRMIINGHYENETAQTSCSMIQILHSQKISYGVIQEMTSIMASTESSIGNDFEIEIEMYDCNRCCKIIRLKGSTDLTKNQFVKIMDQTAERLISIQNEWKVGGGKMK